MLSIHDRPFCPDVPHRVRALGGRPDRRTGPPVGDRHTRTIRLLHLPARDAEGLRAAIRTRIAELPSSMLRSITWEQGAEMARHLTISADLSASVYFQASSTDLPLIEG